MNSFIYDGTILVANEIPTRIRTKFQIVLELATKMEIHPANYSVQQRTEFPLAVLNVLFFLSLCIHVFHN